MNTSATIIACGAVSYLVGAIPFGLLLARARGVDIRAVGSGNIGATNVFRSVGRGWGLLTFLLDALKGFLPAFLLPRLLGVSEPHLQTAAVVSGGMAVVGHNWPVYVRFKGGKGVATSAGALLGIAPFAVGIGLLTWVAVLLSSRYVSVASMAAAVSVAGAAWTVYACADGGARCRLTPWALTVMAALVVWRHRGNISRLRAGKEHRFVFGRKKRSAAGEGGAS